MLKSPFRYAGGKSYAKYKILPLFCQHFDYVEPFVGGGSLFFGKKKSKNNWLNDIDSELITTFQVIRDSPEKLIEILRGYFPSRELHAKLRKSEFESPVETAAKYWYLNHTSFGGMMHNHKGTFYYDEQYSKPYNRWASSVRASSVKLQGVKLTNLDFETVIDTAVDNSLLFIDPPYFDVTKNLYRFGFSENDHFRLSKCLERNQNRLKYVVTYDNHDFIKNLYEFLPTQFSETWYYSSRNFNAADKKACNELILSNYEVPQVRQFSFF